MLAEFERHAIKTAQKPFFYFEGLTMTYGEARLRAAGLARALKLMGVRPGSLIAADMPNCPALVLLYLAAAYGSFSLVFLNSRWSDEEKQERLSLVEAQGKKLAARFNEKTLNDIIYQMGDDSALMHCSTYAEQGKSIFDASQPAVYLFSSGTSGTPKIIEHSWACLAASCEAFNARLGLQGEELWQLSLPLFHVGGLQILGRSIQAGSSFILYRKFNAQKLLDDLVEYLPSHISVVNKSLRDLLSAARVWKPSQKASLAASPRGSHARKENAFTPQSLSELLADTLVSGRHAKHARTAEDLREARLAEAKNMLAAYDCILLGGSAPDQALLDEASEAKLNLYVSYGMTETASAIAATAVQDNFKGSLKLFQNVEAQIKQADKQGFGELWLRTPALCAGYLGMTESERSQLFDDRGFFNTKDRAQLTGRNLFVTERTEDLFVSGGENIYPQEIAQKLQRIVGIADAFVFAVEHPVWGKRPVACVEKSPDYSFDAVYRELSYQLPRMFGSLNRPDSVLVLECFPRISIGKTDKQVLKHLFERSLRFDNLSCEVRFRSLAKPLVTAQQTLTARPSLMLKGQVQLMCDQEGSFDAAYQAATNIDQLEDGSPDQKSVQARNQGRKTPAHTHTLIAEDPAFETDWYFPETIRQDQAYLEEELIPFMQKFAFLDPDHAFDALLSRPEAAHHPLAVSAANQLYWELLALKTKKPLWSCLQDAFAQGAQISGLVYEDVPTNTVFCIQDGQGFAVAACALGLSDPDTLRSQVEEGVAQGYTRIKFKVSPETDFALLKELIASYPDIQFSADANQSFTLEHTQELQALDSAGFVYIEEPLRPESVFSLETHLKQLEELQAQMKTPIALDESLVTFQDHTLALASLVPVIMLKPAKLGGLSGALRWYLQALKHKKECVIGGFFEGVTGKRASAAFQSLPGFTTPGDFTCPSKIFAKDKDSESLNIVLGWIPLS